MSQLQQRRQYRIAYLFKGADTTFYIRAALMNDAEAWHWATINAGLAKIPKYPTDKSPKLTRQQAEKLGIANLLWSLT
jgi:hypothetical protein